MNIIFERESEGSVQDTLKLVTWEFPEGQFSLALPEGFVRMDENKQEGCYPMSNRPQLILDKEQDEAQVTIHFFHKAMNKEDAKRAIEQIFELTRKSYVQYKYSPTYLYVQDGIFIGWFLMCMKDIKKEHIKAVFSIKGYMVLLTFTYPEEEKLKWRTMKDYIFASIKEESSATGYE